MDDLDHKQSMDEWRESVRMSSSSSCLLSSRQSEAVKLVIHPTPQGNIETKRQYKGRIRTWPGLLLLTVIVVGATVLIVFTAMSAREASKIRTQRANAILFKNKSGTLLPSDIIDSIISEPDEDGQYGNPKVYPTSQCAQLDYQSKNGKMYAVLPNKTEIPFSIKGVNWFGMETGLAIPFGLWENSQNGTTAYIIATFLSANKFNAVRLPVCIESILKNTKPERSLINIEANRALDISNYMSMVKSIVKTLAYRQIGVLISLHTLTTMVSGGNWYSAALGISKDDFLTAVDKLTKNLCTNDYWNIIGLDAKNEPHESSWAEFADGAGIIGERMLKGCPKWTLFVEGVNKGTRSVKIGTDTFNYFDWWGGGLQEAGELPVKLATENKIVYSPHYYNTGVYPQPYLYGPGGISQELDDKTLKTRIQGTSYDMFGYLNKNKKEAVVMGEFAGLYAKDGHPKKTTKRTTDLLIEIMAEEEYAGAFMWSLNPESAYQYNPNPGTYTEGLLLDDWQTPNKEFLKGMAAMDSFQHLKPLPCVPVTKTVRS